MKLTFQSGLINLLECVAFCANVIQKMGWIKKNAGGEGGKNSLMF